jgi:hypothetical protein
LRLESASVSASARPDIRTGWCLPHPTHLQAGVCLEDNLSDDPADEVTGSWATAH